MAEAARAIAELLPHAGRAIFLDAITGETAHGVIATTRIRPSHPFFSTQLRGVPSWVGIELMAQTISLHAGLQVCREDQAPRAGYLLGARHYLSAIPSFREGLELEIRAERLYLDTSGLGAYDCTILIGTEVVATATITVFQTQQEVAR